MTAVANFLQTSTATLTAYTTPLQHTLKVFNGTVLITKGFGKTFFDKELSFFGCTTSLSTIGAIGRWGVLTAYTFEDWSHFVAGDNRDHKPVIDSRLGRTQFLLDTVCAFMVLSTFVDYWTGQESSFCNHILYGTWLASTVLKTIDPEKDSSFAGWKLPTKEDSLDWEQLNKWLSLIHVVLIVANNYARDPIKSIGYVQSWDLVRGGVMTATGLISLKGSAGALYSRVGKQAPAYPDAG